MLGDRHPTLEDIQALRFTTRVLNESMRLYPQPPVLIRRALADDVLYGYKVRAFSQRHVVCTARAVPKALTCCSMAAFWHSSFNLVVSATRIIVSTQTL